MTNSKNSDADRAMRAQAPLVAKRDQATGRVVTLDKVIDPATGKAIRALPGG